MGVLDGTGGGAPAGAGRGYRGRRQARLQGDRKTLLLTGDAVQNNHVSLAHPDWQPAADMDGAEAAKNRRQLLDLAATDKPEVLCYHMPFPGLGRVERMGSAFAWTAGV
jgi:glyoxylase-like metal-dependent hydrolase (beta-lactamase superfamily II)